MKKKLALLLIAAMLLGLLVGCGGGGEEPPADDGGDDGDVEVAEDAKVIGVFFYQFNDAYLSTVRNEMDALDKEDDEFEFVFLDAQGDQGKQNDQIDAQLEKVDAFLINLPDTGAAEAVINKIKDTEKPLIFFNREPEDIDAYKQYDKAKFVGTKIEEAGILQGELALAYWEETEDADRNGNGVLDYVLLHGGLDNAEAIARSEYSVQAVVDGGVEVNELAQQICNWDTAKAKDAMDAWLSRDAENIDVVFANNDGMAIGAINALKAIGYNTPDEDGNYDPDKYIAVFGVDAINDAIVLIEEGSMVGTVKQDGAAMAKALVDMGKNAAYGKDFLEGTDYEYDDSGFAVRIPYQKFEVVE